MVVRSNNITWHDNKISKEDRYRLNGHRSYILWFTGLSGAGKSTLSVAIEKALYDYHIRSYILDGDNIRHGLNRNLGFSLEDRKENIRRIGEVSKLFVNAGLFVLCAFISPYREDRAMVREMFSEGEFIEIYVKCSIDECERRDPKGIYKKALLGEIKNFTGISAPYEEPLQPEILVQYDKQSIEESVNQIMNYLQENCYI